jgi:hypothetical protein
MKTIAFYTRSHQASGFTVTFPLYCVFGHYEKVNKEMKGQRNLLIAYVVVVGKLVSVKLCLVCELSARAKSIKTFIYNLLF